MLNFNRKIDFALSNFSRLLLAGLIGFEGLNLFGFLAYDPTFTWLGLLLTASALWLGMEIFSFYIRRKCPSTLLRTSFGLSFFVVTIAIYFDAFGDFFHYYAIVDRYDQFAHLIGGGASALVFLSVFQNLQKCGKIKLGPTIASIFFIVASTALLGVIYELEEYFEDILTGSNRLGDAFDTANDLFLDLAGALIIAIISTLYVRRRMRTPN